MGQCGFVNEDKSFLNGYYCNILKGRVDEPSIVHNYCKSSVHCDKCPYRGGDDSRRKKEEPKPEPAKKVYVDTNEYIGGSGGGGGTGGSGGGSSSIGFFDLLGAFGSWLKIMLIAFVVSAVFVIAGNVTGFLGPWVQMQVPDTADTENLMLYTLNREDGSLYKTDTGDFDDTGLGKLRAKTGYSDVFLELDGASVWLGTCDLLTLNTAVVEDLTYEEAIEQMVRPVVIQLTDAQGEVLVDAAVCVLDRQGQALCVTPLAGGYAVLLPNEMTEQTLTIQVEGYQEVYAEVSGRLTFLTVELVGSDGGAQ